MRQTRLYPAILFLYFISGAIAQSPSGPVLSTNPLTGNYTWKLAPNLAASVTFKATSGVAPYSFAIAAGALPTGLVLDPVKGTVSGTPTVPGFFPFSVQITGSDGQSSVTKVSFTIVGSGPQVLTQTLPDARAGFYYDYGLIATGGHPGGAPYLYEWQITSGAVPPGITFTNGFFFGTPFNPGAYNFTVTVRDYAGGSFVQPLTMNVVSLEITTTTLPGVLEGVSYSQTLSAQNGAPPLYWSLLSGNLPAGITFSHSGVLSGTAKSAGIFVFTVQVSDGAGRTAQQQLTLNVTPLLPLVITTQSIADAVQGQAYSTTLVAAGGVAPYQWSLFSGVLPPGIALGASTGVLSGTATQSGQFPAQFQVQDSNGATAKLSLTLTVEIPKPAISSVVNGASFAPGSLAAPGSILSVFASSLGTQDQLNGFPATSLDGVTVTLNGSPAPLFAVAATKSQINFFAPWDLPTSGEVSVVVTSPNGASQAYQLQMAPAAPGIFRLADPSKPGRQYAVALLSGTAWLPIPSATAAALHLPSNCSSGLVNKQSACGQPARAGDVLEIFTTGLGLATPNGDPRGTPLSGAQVAPASGNPLYETVMNPAVTIGGAAAQVLFSGLAPGYAGLYQVNVVVPGSAPPGDAIQVLISMPNGLNDEAPVAIAGR